MPLLQALSRSALQVVGDRSPIARTLRPAYRRVLQSWYGRRGMPWVINGQRFRVDPSFRAHMSVEYDSDVASVLRARVRPGDICFDIGANVGVYALQFAGWTGARGRVFAFEPNPPARAVLEQHVRINGLEDRVEVVPLAVGDTNGEVTFTGCGTDGMSRVGPANPLLAGRAECTSFSVPMTTIDEFCRQRGFEPDWLFLDVEGHEIAALRGARSVIAKRRETLRIVVEMHPASWLEAGTNAAEAALLLAELKRVPIAADGRPASLEQHRTVFLEPVT